MPQSSKKVCNILNDITPMNKNKWFMNFFISLLNDNSYNYIKNKSYKMSQDFQDILIAAIRENKLNELFSNSNGYIKDYLFNPKLQIFQILLATAIEHNTINELFKNNAVKDYLTKINKIILNKKNTDFFDSIVYNNYLNFFLFPYFINFLNFSCITFEYYDKKLYGGIYKYLKKVEVEKQKHYYINKTSINNSNGFDYDYGKHRHPEYLIINLWMENDNLEDLSEDNLLDSIEIDKYTNTKSISDNLLKRDDTYNEILEYNGYKYYLKSFLIENYNFKDYKQPRHTITFIKCRNTQYVYTNSSINKSTYLYSKLLGNKETIPCTELIELKDNIYGDKGLSFSDTECGLFSYRKEDLKTKYCYSLSKGRRVLIYVREEEAEKKKRDDAEKAAQEKRDKEAELEGKVVDKIKDGKKVETDAEKEARIKKENQDRLCKNIFDYVDKIRTKIDKQDIDEKMKKDKDFVMKKLKELEDNEKNYAAHKADLEKTKKDIEKMHKDNLEELKKYIEELKKKRTILHV